MCVYSSCLISTSTLLLSFDMMNIRTFIATTISVFNTAARAASFIRPEKSLLEI